MKIYDTIAAVLGIFGLVLAIIEYELFYYVQSEVRCYDKEVSINQNQSSNNTFQSANTTLPFNTTMYFCNLTIDENTIIYSSPNKTPLIPMEKEFFYKISGLSGFLRVLITIFTACGIGLQVVHSIIAWNLDKEKGLIPADVPYMNSRNFKQFFLEALINAIHCPMAVDDVFKITQLGRTMYYSLNGICMVWMLLRFYLVFRLFAHYSKYTSEKAEECCEPEGAEANTVFAVKAVLKEKPYSSLLFLIVISTLVFGIAVRHFERPYYQLMSLSDSSYQDYTYLWNGMWLVMITMTTVGYGDFYPRTHMGRFICILACFWGVFLVSMVTVTLSITTTLSHREQKAFDLVFRLKIKEKMKKKAVYVMTLTLKMLALVKKNELNLIDKNLFTAKSIQIRNNLEMKLEHYRVAKQQLPFYEISAEELLRQLSEKIDRDLDEVREVIFSLIQIEKQLNEIEESQEVIHTALSEAIVFTQNLYHQILKIDGRNNRKDFLGDDKRRSSGESRHD